MTQLKLLITFFKEAVSKLSIQENSDLVDIMDSADTNDPVDIAIAIYKNHPSILKIKENVDTYFDFNFTEVSLKEAENQIHKLDVKKATTFKNIPPKILKDNADIVCPILRDLINGSFKNNTPLMN